MQPVQDIYAWITSQFPFFKTLASCPASWRSCVRHNLVRNSAFACIIKHMPVEASTGGALRKFKLWRISDSHKYAAR
jgi:hypothetical protein